MTRAVVVDDQLALVGLDLATAQAIIAHDRSGRAWAPDFPSDDDVVVAGMVALAGPHAVTATRQLPWASPWLVLDEGVAVGALGFKGPPEAGVAELGYDLVPSARGRGIMTRALAALIALAPDDVAWIVAETVPANGPSRRVLERLGFAEVGRRVSREDGELLVWRRAR